MWNIGMGWFAGCMIAEAVVGNMTMCILYAYAGAWCMTQLQRERKAQR